MPRQVLIVQRRLPHYRVAFFERLRARLGTEGIELRVAYGLPAPWEKSRADQGELAWGTLLHSRYLSRAVWLGLPWKKLIQQDLIVLSHENAILDNYVLLALRHRLRARLAFWGHGRNFQHQAPARDRLKRWMLRGVDHYFAYTELSARVLSEQGMPVERITVVQNAVDTAQLAAWRAGITLKEQRQCLRKLGLEGTRVGLYLGSLIPEKRIGWIFDAAMALRERFADFELIVIGDGPLREKIRGVVQKYPWACWVGARVGREKAVLGALGHVLLNPGMVGLSILDAFALGLPMVTTDCGIHSPEIAYLESGRNGLLMPDSLEAFVEGAARLFGDDQQRQSMATACLEDAGRYSLDGMVERFAGGILGLLGEGHHR